MSKRLTDKELAKFTSIIGARGIISLYIEDRINLTSKQLDKMIAIKNGEDYNNANRAKKEKENK